MCRFAIKDLRKDFAISQVNWTKDQTHLKTGTGKAWAVQLMTVISVETSPLKCFCSFPALSFGLTLPTGSEQKINWKSSIVKFDCIFGISGAREMILYSFQGLTMSSRSISWVCSFFLSQSDNYVSMFLLFSWNFKALSFEKLLRKLLNKKLLENKLKKALKFQVSSVNQIKI